MHTDKTVSLGFTGQRFARGAHVCQIFSEDEERQSALLDYILSGVRENDKVACFSAMMRDEAVDEYLANYGISYSEQKRKGAVHLSGAREVYFKYNRFDPDQMLEILHNFYETSQQEGFDGARVIGEMLPEIHTIEGGSRLMEYEARVTMFLRSCPATAVCQYDSRVFDGETIMEVLKVHPYMVVRGGVVNNPFFYQPEDYLEHRNRLR